MHKKSQKAISVVVVFIALFLPEEKGHTSTRHPESYILFLFSDLDPPSVSSLRPEPAEEFRPVTQAERTLFFFTVSNTCHSCTFDIKSCIDKSWMRQIDVVINCIATRVILVY